MDRQTRRVPLRVPELGMDGVPLTLCLWLVRQGQAVSWGERIVELLAGVAVVELLAPCDGVLVEKRVPEDTPVHTGQVLGWLTASTQIAVPTDV